MKRALVFVLTCLIAHSALAEAITVAAAISLKDALTHVSEQYKSDTGEMVEFTFGSSGQLASQIQNGAPIDLFISAASKQVDDLVKAGNADAASLRILAGNSLVLVVPADSRDPPTTPKALSDSAVTRIAIGEPKSVPAGQYAEQALRHAGIYEAVEEKLVFGTNARQVLDYVERGEVSAGMVYATDAKMSAAKTRIAFTVDGSDHEPIVYPAVVVAASHKKTTAAKFVDYILSDKGQAKLRAFGFTPPPQPTNKPTR